MHLKIGKISDPIGTIVYRLWQAESSKGEPMIPNGVIQVLHGMMEHLQWYEPLAKYLTDQGWVVMAHDHIGCGSTAEDFEQLGRLPKNGWTKMQADTQRVRAHIRQLFPEVPVILLGHSMGSFLAGTHLKHHHDQYSGLILSGSTAPNPFELFYAKAVARLIAFFRGWNTPATLIHYLVFGAYTKRIESPKTPYDWLSREQSFVTDYINDPKSGQVVSNGYFVELFKGMAEFAKWEWVDALPEKYPVLCISGSNDPVSQYGKQLKPLEEQLACTALTTHIYEGARHVVLAETNQQAVFNDLFQWIVSQTTTEKSVTNISDD